MRRICFSIISTVLAVSCAQAQLKQLKPGWNLFSVQQDEQLGKEAALQVQQQMRVVHNAELDDYLAGLLHKLQQSPHGKYFGGTDEPIPYTIHAVYDKNINAFSLPGGPIFINTGLIDAAENEAQLAGVISHEMSHVVLRHATNQITKQNLISLPAMLAGAIVGNSLFGQLAQLGLGLGANSVLLKFSRTAESQADYNGAQIMADAGYNPIEMAHFFEKLESKSSSSLVAQFLSDHPNPGNRVQVVEDEIRQMPRRSYLPSDSAGFQRARDLVLHLAPPGHLKGSYGNDAHSAQPPAARPSSHLIEYRGRAFSFNYPENWQVYGDRQSSMVTIAPHEGLLQGANGQVAIGYGMEASYYVPQSNDVELNRDTLALIQQLENRNQGMHVARASGSVSVGGEHGLETSLGSPSPYQGEQEVDELITLVRPEGLFYLIFTCPRSEFEQIQGIFQDILRSVRFF